MRRMPTPASIVSAGACQRARRALLPNRWTLCPPISSCNGRIIMAVTLARAAWEACLSSPRHLLTGGPLPALRSRTSLRFNFFSLAALQGRVVASVDLFDARIRLQLRGRTGLSSRTPRACRRPCYYSPRQSACCPVVMGSLRAPLTQGKMDMSTTLSSGRAALYGADSAGVRINPVRARQALGYRCLIMNSALRGTPTERRLATVYVFGLCQGISVAHSRRCGMIKPASASWDELECYAAASHVRSRRSSLAFLGRHHGSFGGRESQNVGRLISSGAAPCAVER